MWIKFKHFTEKRGKHILKACRADKGKEEPAGCISGNAYSEGRNKTWNEERNVYGQEKEKIPKENVSDAHHEK